MKHIYKIFILLFATSFVLSCGKDWLDTEPADGVNADEAIGNYLDLLNARTGMYDGIQGNSSKTSYYGARMIYYGDVRGDDMQAQKAGNRTSALYEMNYNADNAPNMWNIPYEVLRRANRVIEAIDEKKVEDGTAADINRIYSEALVVRALVHFDLARVYGKPYTADNGASLGVPIMLEPMAATELPTRNTVKEVYDQVIADLTKAIESNALPTTKTAGFINAWTAKSLLSRVYLYMGDNAKSLSLAEDVINNSPYLLWENEKYGEAWNKDAGNHGDEMIFEIINASSDDWTDREGIAYLYNEDGYADAIATKAFIDLIMEDPNDARIQALIAPIKEDNIKLYGTDPVFINKYPADRTGEMRLNNVPVIRLSEVYLNAAEAAVKSGNNASAVKYLNAIIKRANPDAESVATATLELVLTERRKELIGEGHRFFDALRNNLTITRYTDEAARGYHYSLAEPKSRKFDRTYYRTILPIPINEVDANAEISKQQNPEY